MPLLYRPWQSNVASDDGINKYFPTLVKFKKKVGTKELAEEIAYGTTLVPGDVYHSIRSVSHYMFKHLLNSRSVHLEGLGTFTLKASSSGNGVDNPEDVSPRQINYLRVQFTPEYTRPMGVGTTRSQFANVEYELYGGNADATDENEGGSGSGGSGDPNA